MKLKPAYAYFGGKSKVAELVWSVLGDVPNYVEPFFGGGSVLLERNISSNPTFLRHESINDANGLVVNFWRAIKFDPDAVAYWVDYPISEIDLHNREVWLLNRTERLLWSLEDPDFYNAKIAGWWAWGMCQSIGMRYCVGDGSNSKPRPSTNGLIARTNYAYGLNKVINRLSNRMQYVSIYCGDWERMVCSYSMLEHFGITGIFLDPPYSYDTGRSKKIYANDDGQVSIRVRKWCLEHGENLNLRIMLCGYEGEHELPGWRCVKGKTGGGRGMASTGHGDGYENCERERLWLSPGCLDIEVKDLFG